MEIFKGNIRDASPETYSRHIFGHIFEKLIICPQQTKKTEKKDLIIAFCTLKASIKIIK